jgi:hypothetical protein
MPPTREISRRSRVLHLLLLFGATTVILCPLGEEGRLLERLGPRLSDLLDEMLLLRLLALLPTPCLERLLCGRSVCSSDLVR